MGYDHDQHQRHSSISCDGLGLIQEEREEEESHPPPSVQTSVQLQEEQQQHARQSVRPRPSTQQQQRHTRQSARTSIFLQREDELNRRLHASEDARRKLEAQVVELQRRPQTAEHTIFPPSTPPPQVMDPELSGAGNELWEECEKLRNELGKSNQAKDNANWEAKDYQRRLQASEALSQELQTRLSDTESRAHLAEKQFRDWQHQAHETWWSSMACHCLQKKGEQVATPANEEQLQLSRKPRPAHHMKAARNTGASWLARPLG